MPESGTFGSVRGVPGNGHPYRDRCAWRRTGLRPWTTRRCAAALPTVATSTTCPQPSTMKLKKNEPKRQQADG